MNELRENLDLSSITIGNHILIKLLGFTRHLMNSGVQVGLSQVVDFVRGVALTSLQEEDIRTVGLSTLINRKEDIDKFNAAWENYWRGEKIDQAGSSLPSQSHKSDGLLPRINNESTAMRNNLSVQPQTIDISHDTDNNNETPNNLATLYSPDEILRHKDFSKLSPDELLRARKLIQQMRLQMPLRRSRRLVLSIKGRKLDIRKSLRNQIKYRELISTSWKDRKFKPRKIVLLCDISGSMAPYASMLIHFMYTLRQDNTAIETFVFGTKLTRITKLMQSKDIDRVLKRVSEEVQDWAGGTRIGESLHAFNTRWSRRMLQQGAIVIIISDGWDCGDVDLLSREMARLQRSSYRLIWLNPLLGTPGYEPLTRGIRAAMPFIDDFISAHSLASLEHLVRLLGEIPSVRSQRKQVPGFLI